MEGSQSVRAWARLSRSSDHIPRRRWRSATPKTVEPGVMGSGQVVKLADNLITAINIVALGEALTTMVREGVDSDR